MRSMWSAAALLGLSLVFGCGQRGTGPAAALVPGTRGTLEFTVSTIKYAPRRETYFLCSSANFRGAENQIVALRRKDWKGKPNQVLPELEDKYQGQHIRAQGDAVDDEGQRVLVVTSPSELQILASPPGSKSAASPAERHRSRHGEPES